MRTGLRRLCGAGAIVLLAGCRADRAPLPVPTRVPPPDPASVEQVIYLVGDAGIARDETHPLLARLRADVEEWSSRLRSDSAVTVVILGDNVYPLGLHPPDAPEFDRDTAVLMAQVRLVGGPAARAAGARAFFVAGNHDWGLKEEFKGFVRVTAMSDFLTAARERTGAAVRLVPQAGTGGPHVVDLGRHVRLILLDTAWWLLQADVAQKTRVLEGIERAMQGAGGRQVVIAAHHPYRTAGPHGGEVSFWRTFGIQYLLTRSGAVLQDLSSAPYRRLQRGLRDIFTRTGPPILFAGGHEHSLQVFGAVAPTDPRYMVVSGSASKLQDVGGARGLRFGAAAPGYMRVLVEKDGGMTLFVEAGPEAPLVCPEGGSEHAPCMERGIAAIRTVHSERLR